MVTQGRGWQRLDNAAKIFPPTSTTRDPRVFRFACELREDVDGDCLQQALTETLERFPLYQVVMKKGFFWYYLEDSPLTPLVTQEEMHPCAPLYHPGRKNLLFRVMYHASRINLECYHVLSDGTGALAFLRTMALRYLCLRFPETLGSLNLNIDHDASHGQSRTDSFETYYEKPDSSRRPARPRAYCLRGELLSDFRIGVFEGSLSTQAMLTASRALSVTVTELLTANLMCAIHENMKLRERRQPVVVTVPVNLRKYFPSATARNFFGVVDISHDFSGGVQDLPEVAKLVHASMAEELSPEKLRITMNRFSALEHNMLTRVVPLIIKTPSMRWATSLGDRGVTATLSNVGIVAMPPETDDYIRMFAVYTSARHIQACVCSYRDHMTVSLTSNYAQTDVQRVFFRNLTGMDVPVTVATNLHEFG